MLEHVWPGLGSVARMHLDYTDRNTVTLLHNMTLIPPCCVRGCGCNHCRLDSVLITASEVRSTVAGMHSRHKSPGRTISNTRVLAPIIGYWVTTCSFSLPLGCIICSHLMCLPLIKSRPTRKREWEAKFKSLKRPGPRNI